MPWFSGKPRQENLQLYRSQSFNAAADEFQKLQLLDRIHKANNVRKVFKQAALELHPNKKLSRMDRTHQNYEVAKAQAQADFVRMMDAYEALKRYQDKDFMKYLVAYRQQRIGNMPLPMTDNGWSIL